MLNYLLDIIYPNLCVHCDARFTKGEILLCTQCKATLPVINHHDLNDHPLQLKLEGRLPVENAYAYLSFHKTNITQDLIHQLKYEHRKQVGLKLGQWFGNAIRETLNDNSVDMIVPVPIHRKKLMKRGFNQSDCIARGISAATGISVSSKALVRKHRTATQTRRSRKERVENVMKVFEVKLKDALKDKHVLLVDDVITTGATMEACGMQVLNNGAAKVSIASLAVAQ